MSMYWIYDLPNGLLGLLTITLFVAVSVAGLHLSKPLRRWIVGDSGRYNDIVCYFFGAAGVLYGLALGLIAVATYQNYADADSKASKEAASIAALYRDVDSYAHPLRGNLEGNLRDYTKFVIAQEWPAHRQGRVLGEGDDRLEEIENRLAAYEPATEREKIGHAEVVRSLNQLIESRGYRVQAVSVGLPLVLWTVVLLSAVLNVFVSYLFWLENRRLHTVLVATFSASIGLMIFLTAAMDNPFRGELSVSPNAYQVALDTVLTPKHASGR